MKRLILCALIICLLFCSGCTENVTLENKAELGQIEYVDFTEDIVADKDTHILYYRYIRNDGVILSPYYSKNGNLCRYEDGKIIEVENDDRDSN